MPNMFGDNPGAVVGNGCGAGSMPVAVGLAAQASHPTDKARAFSTGPVLQSLSIEYLLSD
jgi:hypothetical protein